MSELRLGIDIGGTGTKAALVDICSGTLHTERIKLKTPQPATKEALADVIRQVIKIFDWSAPVGCCFPAVIKNNICKTASNIPDEWIGVDLAAFFEEQCGLPFQFMNDADLAGIAELRYGSIKDTSGVIIMLTLGTGIGSALFIDGRLVPNTELGQLYYRESIFEDYASNKARKKNDWTYQEWAVHLNELLRHVQAIFWPKCIILGGGISKRLHLYRSYLDAELPIMAAELQNAAGVIGAAGLTEVQINSIS